MKSKQTLKTPVTLPDIEVLRPGTFTDMNGVSVAVSLADLREMAAGYDAQSEPAPAVLGHPETDHPAMAWASGFKLVDNKLVASLSQAKAEFVQSVRDGEYKRISLSFYQKDHPGNPKPGQFYPKHIGFLGATAPVVKGLKPVAFAEQITTLSIQFSQLEEQSVPKLKEAMIEAADPTDSAVIAAQAVSLAEAKTALDKREAAIKAREDASDLAAKNAREAAAVSFAEGLVATGKLPPVHKEQVVYLAKALANMPMQAVSFGEGDAAAQPGDVFKALFDFAVPAIQFSELAKDDGESGSKKVGAVSFAAPSGHSADPAALQVHNAALVLQQDNKDLSYLDAVKRASAA